MSAESELRLNNHDVVYLCNLIMFQRGVTMYGAVLRNAMGLLSSLEGRCDTL